jgi:DNA repair protein RadB
MIERISSGVDFVNEFLNGGYENDAITTMYGPAGAGKTNFAMLLAVSMAKQNKKVLYIDTEGGFSLDRLRQLHPEYKEILEHILFLKPMSFEEQKGIFEKLRELCSKKIGCIIVDTIAMLYRLEKRQGEDFFDINRELGAQIAKLTEITRKLKIPVFMTNQIYTNIRTGEAKMVGGDILTYGSKCLLELQTHGKNRKLILRKHRSMPSGSTKIFRITGTGIEAIE